MFWSEIGSGFGEPGGTPQEGSVGLLHEVVHCMLHNISVPLHAGTTCNKLVAILAVSNTFRCFLRKILQAIATKKSKIKRKKRKKRKKYMCVPASHTFLRNFAHLLNSVWAIYFTLFFIYFFVIFYIIYKW